MSRKYKLNFMMKLWCDKDERHTIDFIGRSPKTVAQIAKRAGWKVHDENETATCPQCQRFKVEYKRKRIRYGQQNRLL